MRRDITHIQPSAHDTAKSEPQQKKPSQLVVLLALASPIFTGGSPVNDTAGHLTVRRTDETTSHEFKSTHLSDDFGNSIAAVSEHPVSGNDEKTEASTAAAANPHVLLSQV